jgi:hypothetical protein
MSFLRVMRDITRYYIAQDEGQKLLTAGREDPNRTAFLRRFIDQDSRKYLNRFCRAYHGFSPDQALERFSLEDRGYWAGLHPLELWLVTYLRDHPAAPRAEVTTASEAVRQEIYAWLFETHSTHKQDVRIRMLLEQDAFDHILQDWQRQGYPFGHIVPS